MADVNATPLRDVGAAVERLQDEVLTLGRLIWGVKDEALRAALVGMEGRLIDIGVYLDRDCTQLAKEG